jgi:copper chaperone CopZ
MSKVTYNIPNINCMHCVHTIKSELSELAGVKSVEADPKTKQATVVFEAPADEGKIESVLKEINYSPVKG